MCRVCYGPSLSCAEFAMCRVVPKSTEDRDSGRVKLIVIP